MDMEEQSQGYMHVIEHSENGRWEMMKAPGHVPGTNNGDGKKGSLSNPY